MNKKTLLVKSGAINSEMVFQENMLTQSHYNVILLNEQFEVMTNKYEFIEAKDQLKTDLEYDLYSAGNLINQIKMEITISK